MKDSILKLARDEIIKLEPYSSARSEKPHGIIYLNANENNHCLAVNKKINRYPEPQPRRLTEKLSELYGVGEKQIIITRGSDEALDLIMRVFCQPGLDKIMLCPPTYGIYAITAAIQNIKIINVPLLKDQGFKLDKENMIRMWQPKTKMLIICSPNNPTGNQIPSQDLLNICLELANRSIVVIDEAYIEFAESYSMAEFVDYCPNLIVLRTMSKLYGLAGARCGAAISNQGIIGLMKKVIAPYPVPTPIAELVCRYLSRTNLTKIKKQRASIISERETMYNFLKTLPYVRQTWSSKANFLLLAVDDANRLLKHCEESGIIIRDRSCEYGLNNCVRISIGTPKENRILKKTLCGYKF